MELRQRKGIKAIAVFLAFAIAQVYVQISLAEPAAANPSVALPQQFVARLTTRGNQPILVNGNSAASGATILTGATIETPALVGATINLGPLGSLDLAPNTKIQLDFDENGKVKIRLIYGCVILRAKKNTEANIDTEQGNAAKTERKRGGLLDVCFPPGATKATVGAGAAAAAGAGAAGVGGGLGAAAIILIVGGAGAAIGIPLALTRGGNPSTGTSR